MAAALKYTDRAFQEPQGGKFHNHLPRWIAHSEAYHALSRGCKQTLQAIANSCDRPATAEDDLLGARGGTSLEQRAGISTRTFKRHVKELEQCGFIVALKIGGIHRGRTTSNVYGVPGQPGSLNRWKRRRQARMMVKGEDGKYRPVVLEPGDQVTLWPTQDLTPEVVNRNITENATTEVASKCFPSDKMSHRVCQNVTLPSPVPSMRSKEHARPKAKRSGSARRSRRWIDRVQVDDLRCTERLRALFEECLCHGLVVDTEDQWFRFVVAAERCLQIGRKKGAMFGSMVRSRQLHFVSQEDEENACKRLRAWKNRLSPAKGSGEPLASTGDSESVDLSEDAVFVRAAIKAGRARGIRTHDALVRHLHAEDRTWTRERWDKAIRELEQARVERLSR